MAMIMLGVIGKFVLIPVAMLLVVSFFVLVGAEKAQGKRLRFFGYAVAMLLWLSVASILIAGIVQIMGTSRQARSVISSQEPAS